MNLTANPWKKFGPWMNEHRDIFVDLLRAYIGVALLARGVAFLSASSQIHELTSNGLGMWDAFLAHLIPSLHILGGALLIIGLLTRFAALFQIPILMGAVFLVHWREGLFTTHPNLELAALVLVCLFVIAGHGPGRLSADHFLFGENGVKDELVPWAWKGRMRAPRWWDEEEAV
jgi:putative oxidoreductase